MKKYLRKAANVLFRVLVIGMLTLLLVELVYRWQWIDFYKSEWRYQQKDMQKPLHPERRVLVLGDSFSADANSWANIWKRDSLNHSTWVYNASIPGVGPETHRLLIRRRIKEVRPTHVILQLYIGNDLYDVQKPVNWSEFTVGRNVFWTGSNYLRVLGFINYRLGQASVEDGTKGLPATERAGFDPQHYSARTRMFISGSDEYPRDAITLEGGMKTRADDLMDMVVEMQQELDEDVEWVVLVMPHCCQVSGRYVQRYREMGASITDEVVLSDNWSRRLKAHNMKVIDPLEILSEAERAGEKVYFDNDPHLNRKGQQLVMELVRKELKCFEK